MPKELVYCDAPADTDTAQMHVRVGWGDGGSVQVATVYPLRSLPPLSDDEHLSEGNSPASNGWFVNLDRHGINDLIRVLRRARDKAFGPDE